MKNKKYVLFAIFMSALSFFIFIYLHEFSDKRLAAPQNSVEELIELARSGDSESQNRLGIAYETGRNAPQNYEEAAKWYRKAAEKGLARAQNNLGLLYKKGLGVSQDYQEAIKWYQEAAGQGYPEAIANIAQMYAFGWGVEKDEKQALEWFQRAADADFAPAQNRMGLFYRDGKLVPQDYKKAVEFFQKAALQDSSYSKYAKANLAEMYIRGWGVAKNSLKGGELYAEAANAGSEEAQKFLKQAISYCTVDAQIDASQAEWCFIAAFSGNSEVQFTLGALYGSGNYTAQDSTEAAKWYLKAARQGHQMAQALLVISYEREQNHKEAYAWLSVLEQENPKDEMILKMLKTKREILFHLPPKDAMEAQKLAKTYIDQYTTRD